MLERNRDSIHRFAVLFFNVETRWWQPRFVENTPENVQAVLNAVAQRSLEGATDVHAALVEATSPTWRKRNAQPLKADLFLLSDGAATWGQRDVNRMIQTVEAGKSGALFAYQTGLTGTAVGMLERLARGTGGAVFSVVGEEEIERAATAHRQRPWRLLNIAADGASDLLVAGRPQYVYADQTLLIAGRGTPQGAFHLHLRRGEEDQRVTVVVDQTVESELAARTYGQVAVGQLEDLADATEEVAVAYARHFRVTGRTCSLLMLESEADYERFGIGTNDDSVVIDTSPAEDLIRRTADEMAQRLADPKATLQARLARLEKTPGLSFELPTALRLVIDRLPAEAFEISASRLACECETWKQLPKKFSARLASGDIDYETVVAEAERRRESFGAHDALKALSNLIEVDPGEIGVTMDVAFSAMAWGEAGSAYWLLDRVSAARPYLPSVYLAMADCLEQMERPELAMVYYEVAMAADWHERYREIRNIALLHYTRFLQQQTTDDPSSPANDYLVARLRSLRQAGAGGKTDFVVTMLWNTDRTDVDLHVLEPSGEECFYEHAQTRAGGRITPDVTEGYGPEMYTIGDAPAGPYRVSAVYYRTDANRTSSRSRAFVTILQHPGTDRQQITRYAVLLDDHQETHVIATVKMAK